MVNLRITSFVKEALDADLSLQDAMDRGYANLSAVARILKPRMEESVGRNVRVSSIVTALKRLRGRYRPIPGDQGRIVSSSVVNVRTDVAKLALEGSVRVLSRISNLLSSSRGSFLHVSQSLSSVTLILDARDFRLVRSTFRDDEVLDEEQGLAAIIVQSPREIVKTPGCAVTFYNRVSRSGINIEDTSSCFTDTIIVVKMEDVGKAFTALTDLISSYKSRQSRERAARQPAPGPAGPPVRPGR